MLVVKTPQSEDLINRIYNWKFEKALRYLDGQPDHVRREVEMMAEVLGNSGCFGGHMGGLVSLAVIGLIGWENATWP
jgi:hypothetical protein